MSGQAVAGRAPNAILLWGRLVRFSHTIFAMPFALSMWAYVSVARPVPILDFALIIVALVAARTAAMTFNRLVDRDIDALNPRTKTRELPSGQLSVRSAWILFSISAFLFFVAAGLLGLHCLVLAPIVFAVLCGYSWAKRFTPYSHLVLGLALAMAPGGVWYALTAHFAMLPVWMMFGVLCWVAGFDILYSCQDTEFDRKQGLFSLPARFGERTAFWIARLLHVLAIVFLVVFGWVGGLGNIYFFGLGLFGLLLLSQHRLVGPGNLERIDAAFFTRNGAASVLYFVATLLDIYM